MILDSDKLYKKKTKVFRKLCKKYRLIQCEESKFIRAYSIFLQSKLKKLCFQ